MLAPATTNLSNKRRTAAQLEKRMPWHPSQYHPSRYVMRAADSALIDGIEQGQFCTVLAPTQTGKTFLRIQARHRLEEAGYHCASLQASQLLDSPKDYHRWDKQLISAIWDGLFPTDIKPLLDWFRETEALLPHQRLEQFSRDLLWHRLSDRPTTIFIDNIEQISHLPFLTEDLLGWIWHCYCLRKIYPVYSNLNFVILGSAPLSTLTQNKLILANCCAIALSNFELGQTLPFQNQFEGYLNDSQRLVSEVLRWTNGQPLLTHKLCQLLKADLVTMAGRQGAEKNVWPAAPFAETLNQWIDQLVQEAIVETWYQHNELSYLREVWTQITRSRYKKQLVILFHNILTKDPVQLDGNLIQSELLFSGLAIAQHGQLEVGNEIYRHIFTPLTHDYLGLLSKNSSYPIG